MINNIIKRWFILLSLLSITAWLVWAAPEKESDLVLIKPSQTGKKLQHSSMHVGLNRPQKTFEIKPRPFNSGNAIDIFATPKKQLKNRIKPVIQIKPILKLDAPRLPFNYIGKLVENNVTKLFLMEGQSLHVMVEGDTVGDYQLKTVNNNQLTWLYLPLNITQTMRL